MRATYKHQHQASTSDGTSQMSQNKYMVDKYEQRLEGIEIAITQKNKTIYRSLRESFPDLCKEEKLDEDVAIQKGVEAMFRILKDPNIWQRLVC